MTCPMQNKIKLQLWKRWLSWWLVAWRSW